MAPLTAITIVASCFLFGFTSAHLPGETCNQALGMESGAISDSMITASSSFSDRRSPRYARLHQRDGDGGWTANPNDEDSAPSLTIDLGHRARVVAVATQGRYNSNEFVKAFKLAYGDDGENWVFALENQAEKTFQANANSDDVIKTTLPEPVEGRYIRFMPTSYESMISMRVELYGCLMDAHSASFDGSNYLRWDLSPASETLNLEEELIDIQFLTVEPTGILLSADGTQGDFIMIAMDDGKLNLTLNLGSNSLYNDGLFTMEVGSLLDDGHWHSMRYMRVDHEITLQLDGLKVRGELSSDFAKLDLDREMTIGGASDKAKRLHRIKQNFKGCLQNVRISNTVNPSLLGIALDFISEVEIGGRRAFSSVGEFHAGCTSLDTTSLTFPTEDSYLKWTIFTSNNNNFTVHLRFRTFDDDSLMLYNEQGSNQFIALGVRDSRFVVIIKNGGDTIDIPAAVYVNDGLWHRSRVEVASGQVHITIDDTKQTTSFNTGFVSTSTEFYIGGTMLPSGIDTAYLPGFRGCISEIHLQDITVDIASLESTTTPSGVIKNDIQVDTCALFDWCSPNPCEHGSVCSSEWHTFVCDCYGTEYSGAVCHTSNNEQLCVNQLIPGETVIDTDGSGPITPLSVRCAIEDAGSGMYYRWTEISHNVEETMDIPSGNEAPGSYMQRIEYEATMEQIEDLIQHSEQCEQFVRYECTNAKLLNSPSGSPYGWWVNRHDQKMVNWGGAPVGTGRCACGIGMVCAPDNSKYCNCDADSTNDGVDEGYLTEKDHLPVTQLRFGDTGDAGSSASYQLGKLRCRGDVSLTNIVSFVQREAHLAAHMMTTPQGALDVAFDFKTTVDPSDPSDPATAAVFVAADAEKEGLIEVKLVNDRTIQVQFDYGADMMTISVTVPDPLNDDAWHSVQANFDRKEVWLRVDREPVEKMVLDRPELTLALTGPIYIGSSTVQSDGFVGCLRKMRVNGELVDMAAMAETAKDVHAGCVGQCSTEPCLNGGMCIEKYDTVECQCDDTAFGGSYCSVEVGAEMSSGARISYSLPDELKYTKDMDTIILAFKTSQPQGQLFRVENADDGSHIDLVLDGSGYAVLKVRLDSENEETLTEMKNFADNKNHFVTITRNMKEIRFQVDDYIPLKTEGQAFTTTAFTPADIFIGNSGTNGNSFIGCISRVQFNGVDPLKLYFGATRPQGVAGSGFISQSRCGIEEQIPMFLPTEEYPPTEPPMVTQFIPSAAPVSSDLAPGDKAAIAIVVILLLLALCLLLFLIGRYTSRHKGMYSTNEDKGAKNARNADDAVALHGSKRTKEYYM
ncbi:contactin-associated protein-like 2 isoform X2 [Strongylocentrotus purpuratus]|uniref:Neurexin-4 n=1 Tax=Strongylocentrotus purpuratus TaxID=7668 RepID=A0A7M7MZV2_STRPU|nr:contactin-associated protein-like 2 isoform X2 [Strongylocentrotus purpuratus]